MRARPGKAGRGVTDDPTSGPAEAAALPRYTLGAGVAVWLAVRRVRPNWISLASVGFAGLAGVGLLLGREGPALVRVAALVGAAACIQLRLPCNLFDGMVAAPVFFHVTRHYFTP
jgi:hypothetical protein